MQTETTRTNIVLDRHLLDANCLRITNSVMHTFKYVIPLYFALP